MEKFTKPQSNQAQKPTKLSPFVLRAVMTMSSSIIQMRDDCNIKSPDYDFLDNLYTDFQCVAQNNMDRYLEED